MDVDKLLEDAIEAFKVSGESSETASSHATRWCQFKPLKGLKNDENDNQNERRERILKEQNKLRSLKLDERRNLSKKTNEKTSSSSKSQEHSPKHKSDLSELLEPMQSEWMLTVPDDLTNKWLMLFCPVGRRNMVVARNGTTRVFSKTGKQVMQFSSALPAGGTSHGTSNDNLTVIDCIFSQSDLTFYVLDLLYWNGTFLAESDVSFLVLNLL